MYHIITFSYNLFIQFHEFELVAECASLHISGGISVRSSASHFLFVCDVVFYRISHFHLFYRYVLFLCVVFMLL